MYAERSPIVHRPPRLHYLGGFEKMVHISDFQRNQFSLDELYRLIAHGFSFLMAGLRLRQLRFCSEHSAAFL